MEKSNEQFQKDILEIIKKNGEKIEEFKKEVEEKLVKKSEVVEKSQTGKIAKLGYITNILTSTAILLSDEETKRRATELQVIMKPIMEKYQLSKLECFVIRIYE